MSDLVWKSSTYSKIEIDRTYLWSWLFDLLLANPEVYICWRIGKLRFTRTVARQTSASSKILHRNIRIGTRLGNGQLARTASLCIASSKPSTRFPIGWHAQKGYVLSDIYPDMIVGFVCDQGLMCIDLRMMFSWISKMSDFRPKIFNFFRGIELNETGPWSRRFDISLANFGASICSGTESPNFHTGSLDL